MNGVAHIVRRARADDPHTLAVLALAEAMRAGSSAATFAGQGADSVDGVQPLESLASGGASLVVYHQRGPAPALVRRLIDRGGAIAVVGDAAPLADLALRDLRALADAGAAGLAVSGRQAERLTALGFTRVRTVPHVVARKRLVAVGAFEPAAHHLDVALHAPLVLTVDDLVTRENAARVVQAFHVLRTYIARGGQLAVGVNETPETSPAAVRAVYREIWGLRLTDAWAQHLRGTGERAALIRRAAVFVTADPVVGDVRHALAAMAEGVPVIAPADESARDVLGEGALLLPAGAGAELVAEAVAELLNDDARRVRFGVAATRAVARFDPDAVAPVWAEALAS